MYVSSHATKKRDILSHIPHWIIYNQALFRIINTTPVITINTITGNIGMIIFTTLRFHVSEVREARK